MCLYVPLRSCDFLGIILAKNCNIFNFDEVLVSSLTPLHPPRFVADGFDDDGTKSHTSNLAFLGCFSITNPKMFFLTMLCIAKDLTSEIVEVKVSEKSALSSDLLQSPEEKHSSFHICLLTLLISIYSTTFKCIFDSESVHFQKCRAVSTVNEEIFLSS